MKKKWFAVPAAGAAIAGGIILGTSGVADAHTVLLGGSAVCQSDGIYKATYNVVLSGVPGGTTGTFSLGSTVPTDVENTVMGLPASHLNNGIVGPITVNGIAGDLKSTSLTIHAAWTDGFTTNATASVSLAGNCQGPPVVPNPPITPPTLPTTTTTLPPQGKPITPVTTPIVQIPSAAPLANVAQEQLQVAGPTPGTTNGDG